jgi:hypothetical protein
LRDEDSRTRGGVARRGIYVGMTFWKLRPLFACMKGVEMMLQQEIKEAGMNDFYVIK